MRVDFYELQNLRSRSAEKRLFFEFLAISAFWNFPPSFSSCFSVRFPSFSALLPANMEKEREMEKSPHVNPSFDETPDMKETGHLIRNSVNKFASQIKKPPHRRSSPPLNWFPRKKTDSFLTRKLRQLQEGGGMSSSLVETLGNANPHYSRIAREKIAAQEAANKAMEARKAAMVEASWCRILQAARIQRKDAESNLEKAEQCALRAFEEAKLTGVMMFDRPDCPRRPCEVQSSSSANGGKSAHTINASFETEFEVDREVAAAVRKALIVLANCPSSSNGEFRELLRKIRQNPDDYEATQDSLTVSLQFEYEQRGVETESNVASTDISEKHNGISHRKSNFGIVSDCHENNFSTSTDDLVKRMVDRLKELQEDELSSLATIVATCGLNAALHEMQRSEYFDAQGGPQRRSNINQVACASKNNNEDIANMPSLDKFLVKHVSRLEREAQEAQISKKNEEFDREVSVDRPAQEKQITTTSKFTSDLGSILIKHVSKLEREIQEAKKSQKKKISDYLDRSDSIPCSGEKYSSNHELLIGKPASTEEYIQKMKFTRSTEDLKERTDIELLELVSDDEKEEKKKLECNAYMSKPLTKEDNLVLELREITNENLSKSDCNEEMISGEVRAKFGNLEAFSCNGHGTTEFDHASLDKILIKPIHWLEREKMQAGEKGSMPLMKKMDRQLEKVEPLDEILVKHQSNLEKAKQAIVLEKPDFLIPKREKQVENIENLNETLVKHQPKLGRVKLEASQHLENSIKHSNARREARERELQEAWGGLSLGNSLKPHLSKLEKVKDAWRRAEEEEKTSGRDF